jgi:uncharacterized lipoprotein
MCDPARHPLQGSHVAALFLCTMDDQGSCMNFSMKSAALLLFSALFLPGCVTTIPMNYAPSSTMSAEGAVSVGSFDYLPAIKGRVEPNQIRNTAIGDAKFDKNVDSIFRDAVFKELRFVGVDVSDNELQLGGEIQEFLIDDLGYSIDWTVRVKYVVSDASGVRYEAVKEVERTTNKFVNVFGSLNETIKLSVEELLKDPAFVDAIR